MDLKKREFRVRESEIPTSCRICPTGANPLTKVFQRPSFQFHAPLLTMRATKNSPKLSVFAGMRKTMLREASLFFTHVVVTMHEIIPIRERDYLFMHRY
jgi:hypothetical protein